MKQWLLETFFKDFKRECENNATKAYLNAFKELEDAEAEVKKDIEERAEKLAKQKLENMLSIINEQNIITFDKRNKGIYIGGQRMTDSQLQNLKQEVEALQQFDLWKILNETPKELAKHAMFIDDGNLNNQLLKGRVMLYLLDTQSRILSTIKQFAP